MRNAGRYDGMLGVLTALETVAHYHRQGHRLPLALEVIGFADEEGARFGVTLLGSRGLTGQWPAEWLARTDADGVSIAQAMRDFGLIRRRSRRRIAHQTKFAPISNYISNRAHVWRRPIWRWAW